MDSTTPKQIMEKLGEYIIGQDKAKRAVAVALRNRWRRLQVPKDFRDEIIPKNIIMMGPTGVGKTEIARRIAATFDIPFIKVEASKFTEVGYVGGDVESMVRDLVENSVRMIKDREKKKYKNPAMKKARKKLLDLICPHPLLENETEVYKGIRNKISNLLDGEDLDDMYVDIDLRSLKTREKEIDVKDPESVAEAVNDMIKSRFADVLHERVRVKIKEAKKSLLNHEFEQSFEQEDIIEEALDIAQNSGIIFIDEIDKVVKNYTNSSGPDISREGVQRDILPLVEGSTVKTKYGMVKTDHILFIATGAFHMSNISDIIPELQGRFPIRVKLNSLGEKDFARILVEPKNSLIRQYKELLKTEGITLTFTDNAILSLAKTAAKANEEMENIGARRLHTVMEILIDDISFEAPEMDKTEIKIDKAYVEDKLKDVLEDDNLRKFIL